MATSPGRSATQAKPAAMIATETRNKTTRIIALSPRPERAGCFSSERTHSHQRGLALARLLDPGLRRRARYFRQLAEIAERAGDIVMSSFDLEARQHRGCIVAGRCIHRTDARELSGIGLQ